MGKGQNYTKTKFHEGTNLHKGSILHKDTFAQRQFCTNGQFARVTILQQGSFLHESLKNKIK